MIAEHSSSARPGRVVAICLLLLLAAALARGASPAAADAFPGANGRIAYRTDFNKIAVMNSDGSGQTVINTAPQYWQAWPTWSPDGTKIAFVRFTGVFSQIHVMNADGSNAVNVSNSFDSEGGPSWSPDGSKLLFDSTRLESDDRDIYVMDADGTDVARLTGTADPPRDDQDIDAAWSPDGTKIAFASDRGDPNDEEFDTLDIWVMDADGSDPVRLTTGTHTDTMPMWTPDGTKIVFERLWLEADGNDYDIMIVNANGTGLQNLTSASALNDLSPAVSPDGTQIAFSRGSGLGIEIYTMDITGANQTRRTVNTVADEEPHWGPPATGIVIEKQTVPDGSNQVFGFDPSWTTDTINLSDGQQHNAVPLAPGSYSISELAVGGWTQQSAVCSGDDDGTSPAAINLEAGELVVCVFTNSQDAPTTADVTVIKQVVGLEGNVPWAFDFTGTLGAFQLTDGDPDRTFTGVAAGQITITEDALSNYTTAVECLDSQSTVAQSDEATVTFTLTGGEDVTCTFSNTVEEPPAAPALYVTAGGGSVPGAGAYQKNDILKWDGSVWSVWFDGASAGMLATSDIMALDVDDDAAGSAWIAIRQAQKLPGIGKMQPQQIAHYNGSTWSRFFDGGDVGLTTTGERINGLEVLPGSVSPIGTGCQYYLLLTTTAAGGVRNGLDPVINFTGEDVLGFCMTQSGPNTAGWWHLAFEGESEGLPRNSTRGMSASDDAATLYFAVKKNFTGDGGLVRPSELFSFSSGAFSGPLWKAKDHGLMQAVDGIDVVGNIP